MFAKLLPQAAFLYAASLVRQHRQCRTHCALQPPRCCSCLRRRQQPHRAHALAAAASIASRLLRRESGGKQLRLGVDATEFRFKCLAFGGL